jgi:hypothetical protein
VGKAMPSRIQRALLALCFCTGLAGCSGDYRTGDWLWWPGFNPITAGYTYQIPVHDVAFEVQCEIYKFLNEEPDKARPLLAKDKGAGVSLNLQTDLSGSVQYVGVNLEKLGLNSLAELVTQTNKTPSLQAKASGKATVSAQVDFTVQQTKNPNFLAKCDKWLAPENAFKHAYLQLWLDDWLFKYKPYQAWFYNDENFICGQKVTLKSQFLIGVDVSAGVNSFMAPPIILPISGFNVDANPDFTHYVQITLGLSDPPDIKNKPWCNAQQPTNKIGQ